MRPENVIIPMVLAQKRTHKNRGNAEEEILMAFLFVSASILGSVSVAHAQHAMDDNELMIKLKAAAPA
jgi:hypothetical protein